MAAGERRRDRTNAVGPLVYQRLGTMGFEAKVREHMAPLVWAELVGPQVAAATEADKVKDGTLFISTRSAVWSHELTFHKADILQRLNRRIGARPDQPLVREIRFQNRGAFKRDAPAPDRAPSLSPSREELEEVELSPREAKAIETDIASIPDETLRARLRKVRIADARLRTWRMDNGWGPCTVCGDLAPPAYPFDGTVSCARCRISHGYQSGGRL